MSSFSKILVACLLALFTVTSLHAGSKSKNTSKQNSDFSKWKTFDLDASIAEEYVTAKYPIKPRSGTDYWSDYLFYSATAKHINYMIAVAPIDDFIRDDSPEDFDYSAYADMDSLKIGFFECAVEELKEDSEDEEIEILTMEIGQYAGFPCLTFSFRSDEENVSAKKRVILTEYAAYIVMIESDLAKDVANDPVADFFLNSLKVISR